MFSHTKVVAIRLTCILALSKFSFGQVAPIPEYYGTYAVAGGKLLGIDTPSSTMTPAMVTLRIGDRPDGFVKFGNVGALATLSEAKVPVLAEDVRFLFFYESSGVASPMALAKTSILQAHPYVRHFQFVKEWVTQGQLPFLRTTPGSFGSQDERAWDIFPILNAGSMSSSFPSEVSRTVALLLKPIGGHNDMVLAVPATKLSPGLHSLYGGAITSRFMFFVGSPSEAEKLKCLDVTARDMSNLAVQPCSASPGSMPDVPVPLATGPNTESMRRASSLVIEKAVVAQSVQNGQAVGEGTQFPGNARMIVCYVVVNHERAGQVIEFAWIQPNGQERARSSTVLGAPRANDAQFTSSALRPRSLLPRGSWRVDVYVDGAVARQIPFNVN